MYPATGGTVPVDPSLQERTFVRLSLDITPELNNLLNGLAVKTGGTKGDVLRKAIGLIEIAVDALEKGKKFGIAEQDQPLATEIVGIVKASKP